MSTKVKLNLAGFRELRSCPELAAGLGEIASGIAARAGEGYSYDVRQMSTRVVASAYTDSTASMKEEFKNNNLLKAMQS
jgi:hypothetical protein